MERRRPSAQIATAALIVAAMLVNGSGPAWAEPVPQNDGWTQDASMVVGPVTPDSFIVLPLMWQASGDCARSFTQALSLVSVTSPEGTVEPVAHLPGLVAFRPSNPLPLGTVTVSFEASNTPGACFSTEPPLSNSVTVTVQETVTVDTPTVDFALDDPLCEGSGRRFQFFFDVPNPLFSFEAPTPNTNGVQVQAIGGTRLVASRPHTGVDEAACLALTARNMATDTTSETVICGNPRRSPSREEYCGGDCQGGGGAPLWALVVSLGCVLVLRRRSGRPSAH